MTWEPKPRSQYILNSAMADLQNLQYPVSLRWLFYRLLTKGFYKEKNDYKNKMTPLFSKARKLFYNNWKPDILSDETRVPLIYGTGALKEEDIQLKPRVRWDRVQYQPYVVMILFEAKAMTPQFQHYTNEIPLYPFGGDPSIPYKWTISKHIEKFNKRYGKETPVMVLYFGDYDEKGLRILQSALADIKKWCKTDNFKIERIGLTLEQAKKYKLQENPEKPNQYQWEALDDKQAEEIITTSVGKYQDKDLLIKAQKEEQKIWEKLNYESEE